MPLSMGNGNSMRSFGASLSLGDIECLATVNKFGESPSIDIADGLVDIWNFPTQKTYTFSSVADIDSISSSDAGDNQNIEIRGLDSNWDKTIQTIALNGQNRVALTTNLIRVPRLKNVGNTVLAGNVYCYPNTAITGGVPDDTTKVRAFILIGVSVGDNQTLMAIYTIPNAKTGLLVRYYAAAYLATASASLVRMYRREFGGVFQVKETIAINTVGSTFVERPYHPTYPRIPARTDIVMKANSTVDNVAIGAGFDLILKDN